MEGATATAGARGPRLKRWWPTGAKVVILAVAALDALALALLVSGARTWLAHPPEGFRAWFPFLYPSSLVSGSVAVVVVVLLCLRSRGREATLALAASMATFTFFSLALLFLISPWDSGENLGTHVVAKAIDFIPAFALIGTAGFLRFAVLFPRPLKPNELGRVGQVRAGDSLSWFHGAWSAVRREPREARPQESGQAVQGADARSWAVRMLLRFVPRWATRPVVTQSGRLLTRPGVLWTSAIVVAFLPYLLMRLEALAPGFFQAPVGPARLADWVAGVFVMIWMTVPVAGIILGIAVLRLGYGLADEEDRKRMRWMVESLNAVVWIFLGVIPFAVFSMAGLDTPVVEALPGIFFGIMPLIVTLGFAVAVFYDGAVEPSLVVRKSTLYGLFGFALAFLFAITEELVSRYMQASLGLPDGTGTLVASGVVAVVFGAFHGRFERRVEKWIGKSSAAETDTQAMVDGG